MSYPSWPSKIGRFRVKRHSWKRTGYAFKGYKPRIVLHTTETIGLPGYGSGANQPHLTIKLTANGKGLTIWQHQSLNVGARALEGISTNTANCIQVEQCMYSDKAKARSVNGLWVGELTPTELDTLGEFYRALAKLCGVPADVYGGKSRMAQSTWLARNGWGITDHAHVPQNSHWDCGVLDVVGAVARAGSDAGDRTSKPEPPSRDKDRKPRGLEVDGVLGRLSTRELQRQLGTYVDGWIDGQNPYWRHDLWAWPRCRYNAAHSGSKCIRALQKKVGVHVVDGLLGPDTNKAIQRFCNRHLPKRLEIKVDGKLGTQSARAIQRVLNEGKFN